MVVLAIDIQKGITDDRLYNYAEFIGNVQTIIQAARKNNVEVIYVQHDDGPGTGFSVGDTDFEIAEQVEPLKNEKRFYKTVNSCFGNRELAEYLEEIEEDTLIIIGLQTNFCIDASIKSAFERGYKVIVPLGTNSTFDNEYMDSETTYRYYNEMMWNNRFAQCISIQDTLKLINEHYNQTDLKTNYIAKSAVVVGNVIMGDKTNIWHNATVRGDMESIIIGNGTNIQDNAVIHTGEQYPVVIGNDVSIGHSAVVHGCMIGDNSLIGMGAIILNGAVIGKDCIIGAGAVVTQKMQIPDGSLAFGNPAKLIRKLTDEEKTSNRRNALRYVENAQKWRMV